MKKAEGRRQKAEGRRQKAEGRRQKAEGRRQKAEGRSYYFDFLRVLGAFAVVVIHVAAQGWYTPDVHSFEWQVINFWHGCLIRWAVPVFVMISGALFLSRDIPVRKIYSKYIFRIFTAFVFWSFVYAAKDYVKSGSILHFAKNFIGGHYHLWFLFMIVGLYMSIPFMKQIAESESLSKYFIVLALVFTFIIPEAGDVISLFSEKYGSFFVSTLNGFRPPFVIGFTGYFLLGYVLDNMEISPKFERAIYSAGILGAAANVLMSACASVVTNKPHSAFYGPTTLNVLFEAIAVFVFFKKHYDVDSKLMRTLAQYSFGAYLVHDAIIKLLRKIGLSTLTFCPALSVPLISVMVFVLSFAISAILNRIPLLRKYIV